MWVCVAQKRFQLFKGKEWGKGKAFGQCILPNRLCILSFSKDLVATQTHTTHTHTLYYIICKCTQKRKMAQGEREQKARTTVLFIYDGFLIEEMGKEEKERKKVAGLALMVKGMD